MRAWKWIFGICLTILLGAVGAYAQIEDGSKLSCPSPNPFYGTQDGLCFDVETTAPMIVTNGTPTWVPSSTFYVGFFEDFLGDFVFPAVGSVDGAQGPWVQTATNQTTSAVQKADYDGGAVELLVDNDSEVGDIDLYWGDESNIDSSKEPICVFRVQIQTAPAAADTLAWGLYGAQNDLIEATTNNAYFSVAGADLNLDTASDDNSTDVDNTDSGVDVVAATWYEYMLSMNSMHGASATNVKYFYRTSLGGDWTALNATTTFSVGANVQLQPMVHVEKTSGTTTPDLLVDYISCYWER